MPKLIDKALDAIWDVTEPISGTCPVCAFWRGVLLTLVFVGVITWLA